MEPRDDFLKRVCCVYDSKGLNYGQGPFVVGDRIDAIRGFQKEVNTVGSVMGDHPGDFTLFEIGTWNPRSGELILHEAKVSLGVGTGFVRKPEVV